MSFDVARQRFDDDHRVGFEVDLVARRHDKIAVVTFEGDPERSVDGSQNFGVVKLEASRASLAKGDDLGSGVCAAHGVASGKLV